MLVTLNLWGSAILGVALLWQPTVAAHSTFEAWLTARRPARFAIRCDRSTIELRNGNDSARRVTLDRVAFSSSHDSLLEEPRHWDTKLDGSERTLAPGEAAQFKVASLDSGPFADHRIFVIDVLSLQPREHCARLEFHLTSAKVDASPELDTSVSCELPDRDP